MNYRVPDTVFPTDNHLEIPVLRRDMQADFIDLPVAGWGATSRKDRMRGTWHFYVDDEKFSRVWKHPETVLKTKAIACVEVNFSTHDQMPLAAGTYQIFRKRWLSRYWQEQGMPIWVDLNVADKFVEVNLLGVPQGWKSFATHAVDSRLIDLEYHVKIAADHSGDFRMLVYGGASGVAEFCKQHDNLVHIPDARWAARKKDG